MITIETDHTAFAAQTIAAEVLGYQPGISQAGRLGVEMSFTSIDKGSLDTLRKRLRAGGHRVLTSRTR